MENTTIAITKDAQKMLKIFGNKGESYTEIIFKLCNSAKDRQIQDLLMNEKDTVSIEDALTRAKKRWQK
jgi:predicted CopG family antitoxin